MAPPRKLAPAFTFAPRTTADSSALVAAGAQRLAALQNNPMYRPATARDMQIENNLRSTPDIFQSLHGRNVINQKAYNTGSDTPIVTTPTGVLSPNQLTRFSQGPGNIYFQQNPIQNPAVYDPNLPMNAFHQGIKPTGQQGFIATSGPTKGQIETAFTYSAPKSLGAVNQAEQLKNAIFQGNAAPASVSPPKLAKGGVFDFIPGGKWEIVKEFKGNSHKDGGIDIEIKDGIISFPSGDVHPTIKAGIGGFFKNLGAGAYGALEGTLDTVTLGATDQLTDMGYKGLQKLGGSTASEIREQDSIHGYGQTAGAITGGIVSGGAATGTAIAEGSEGLGQGISKGNESKAWARNLGTGLQVGGAIAGLAAGNAGYGSAADASKAATGAAGAAEKAAGAAKAVEGTAGAAEAATAAATAASAAKKAATVSKLASLSEKTGKLAKYNPYIQVGVGALSAGSGASPQSQISSNLSPLISTVGRSLKQSTTTAPPMQSSTPPVTAPSTTTTAVLPSSSTAGANPYMYSSGMDNTNRMPSKFKFVNDLSSFGVNR